MDEKCELDVGGRALGSFEHRSTGEDASNYENKCMRHTSSKGMLTDGPLVFLVLDFNFLA